jgi:5-methylcytosine-specific restriction endonuclease McrA
MGLRQRTWARKKRAELIELLGGQCALCGSTDNLEIDHINGRTWLVRKVDPSWRVSIYWAEYRSGVPLQCLCGDCNTAKANPRGAASVDQGRTAQCPF